MMRCFQLHSLIFLYYATPAGSVFCMVVVGGGSYTYVLPCRTKAAIVLLQLLVDAVFITEREQFGDERDHPRAALAYPLCVEDRGEVRAPAALSY